MKIQPNTHLLQSIRHTSLGWVRALGELIDNALDAHAANITIIGERRGGLSKIEIKDDGEGVPDMTAIFRLGDHKPHVGAGGLGRFGIGLKDAALWLWGVTYIESTRNGKHSMAEVNWERLSRGGDWEIADPLQKTSTGQSGTRIVFQKAERHLPAGKEMDRLCTDLGFIFSPAIKRGARIIIRSGSTDPRELQRCEVPEFSEHVEGKIDVEGRTVSVHVGAVREGVVNPRPGIHYTHRHRVIIPGSSLGCGDHSTARIFGWVILNEQWRLTKNKDDIADYKDALGAAVYEFIKPVLAVAEKQAASLNLRGLEVNVTAALRSALASEKEQRDKGNTKGAVTPKQTDRKRRNASKRQIGTGLHGRLNVGKLRVELDESLDPDRGIGTLDVHGNRVRLASRHAFIAKLMKTGDENGIILSALGLLVHLCVIVPESGQRMLPGMYDVEQEQQFSLMMGRFMDQMIHREPSIKLVA